MPPLTSLTQLLTAIDAAQRVVFDKPFSSTGVGVNGYSHYFLTSGGGTPAGVLPATGSGEVVTDASVGGTPLPDLSGGQKLYLARAMVGLWSSPSNGPTLLLHDRIVQTSGLNANITGLQVVNTVALTRHTTGNDVQCALEHYVQPGTTAVTATVTYTNQDGVVGKVGSCTIGGSSTTENTRSAKRVTLAGGDTGVRSVESVQLSAGTGSAGGFGVVLYKPIVVFGVVEDTPRVLDWMDLGLPEVSPSACLGFYAFDPVTDSPGIHADLDFVIV